MKRTKENKLAYAAGIFDGEGCVKIAKRNPRNGRSVNYSLLAFVTQKDGKMIDWLYGNFGGVVYLKNKTTSGSDWIYEWRVSDAKAYDFLKLIKPFLTTKLKQSELGIRFHERRVYGRYSIGGRFQPLTEGEISIREEMYQEISRLKREYTKSKNPNVQEYTFRSMVQE